MYVAGQFSKLRAANSRRNFEWDPNAKISVAFRGCELAGEAGEVANICKKLERGRIGIRGSRATPEMLAEELADVVICADLLAMQFGINLWEEIVKKFNKTSEANSLTAKLEK